VNGREEIIDHTLLSSGEKQLLLILIKVFLQEKQPAIMMMDEPELSLHICWQQSLIEAIRRINPNCQLIITTHSPSILSKGWSDKVVYMQDIVR
ncbi:MAG: ATP-binding protein, partial [Bacteroidaceae bacterium]|nr:ATP-binding protein [Bacteroidaceae bacterium]